MFVIVLFNYCVYRAAELMTKTGQVVHLKVAKQGAVYCNLSNLLSQPSPTGQRGRTTYLLIFMLTQF